MTNSWKKPLIYAFGGILLGLVFPVMGILYEMLSSGDRLSLSTIVTLHQEQPLLWIIDLAPLVLAVFAALVGMQSARLHETTTQLKEQLDIQVEQVQSEHKLFETLITSSPFAVVQLDNDYRIITFNPAFEELFGYSGEEIIGRNLDELVTSSDNHLEAAEITKSVSSGRIIRKESKRKRQDGTFIDVEIFGVPVFVGGEKIGALGFYHDISEKKETERELRESEARFRSLFNDSPISLWEENFSEVKRILDDLGEVQDVVECLKSDENLVRECIGLVKVLDVNQATLDLYKARTKSELLGGLADVLAEESMEQFRNELIALASGETYFECEIAQRRLDGELIYGMLHLSLAPGYEDTWEKVFISIMDISGRKRAEEKLRFLSFHDSLTGLYNRAYFDEEMARLENSRRFPISIIVCDIDNLKEINDTLGHEAGDQVIRTTANVLKSTIFRKEDVVARIGGDEFAIILHNVSVSENSPIDLRLQQAITDFNDSEDEDGLYRPISLSFGFAIIQSGISIMEGFKKADLQMYLNKQKKNK